MEKLCVSAGKESACNAGDLGSIPGLGRSPGEGKGYPLQYSGMENSMDYTVHGVTKSWTRLSNLHFFSLSFPFLFNFIDFIMTSIKNMFGIYKCFFSEFLSHTYCKIL